MSEIHKKIVPVQDCQTSNKAPKGGFSESISSMGVKFGKIVKIEGEIIIREEMKDSGPYLVVKSIDGKKISPPNELKFVFHSQLPGGEKLLKNINPGKIQWIGYFSGEFDGIVDGEFKYLPVYTGTEFHFEEKFVVLKVE